MMNGATVDGSEIGRYGNLVGCLSHDVSSGINNSRSGYQLVSNFRTISSAIFSTTPLGGGEMVSNRAV